ncbi:MAG TPA: adenylate/guanylate cyclase domain-containing protein [Alphaproteobacteria bacterium]|nr:adenylate/guanylate cyclase domain-containing protein [Alphaproteobacteria bacterium]
MDMKAVFTRVAGSPAPSEEMPARVRAAIAEQQDAGERLAAGVQFGIVLFFAALYAVAPKTYSGDWMVPPVTFALGAFLVAAVARLALVRRGRVAGAAVGVFVVLELALLFLLIWSFHIQYRQPPAFYLKAPTLLYVFIFITLRALRFEARYVLLAGVTAAVGWLAMVLYAVGIDPADDMITRDYVRYLTSNSVLIGGELDKIITILVVTAVLAVAQVRARRMLIRAVVEEAAARDLSRFFAPEIAQRITRAETRILPGHGEARDAGILTIDIRDFTQLAKTLPPSELIGALVEYESRMVPAIQANGGSIDKFLGDGILATFGAAAPSETHAADAMRALEAVVAAADDWSRERAAAGRPPLRIGAAVAAGRVVFGAVGDDSRLEYTVIGEAVNLAVKLEKHNKVGGTRALATADAFELAVQQGYAPAAPVERCGPLHILGVEGPIEVYALAK